jgi:AcrR family transcriptional regulator
MTTQAKTRRKSPTPRGATRSGGRTERVRKAVLSAVLARLKEGDRQFSFQDIANDSGVHVTTIYARWPERASLVLAAYEEHMRKLEIDLTGQWETDLHALGVAIRNFLNDPVEIMVNKMLITAGDDLYQDRMVQRFVSLVGDLAAPLEAAKQQGLVRPEVDSDLIISLIIMPILGLILYTGQAPDDAYVRKLIDHLIHACKTATGDTPPAAPRRRPRPRA